MNRVASALTLMRPRGPSRRTPITLDLHPVTEETLSAREFLALSKQNPGIIQSVRLVMPEPGQRGFGGFVVKYVAPRHKTAG